MREHPDDIEFGRQALGTGAGAISTGRVSPAAQVPAPRNGPVPDLTRFLANDHGNACRLIAMYGGELRYCHAFKKWLVWDGRRWSIDTTDQARRLAKHAMLETLSQTVSRGLGQMAESFARRSLDARGISSLLSMAEPEICSTPPEFDLPTHLLNFNNGTVDLRTGALLPHRREDWMTKLVPFDFQPAAECPRFRRFLDRICAGESLNSEQRVRAGRLIRYLQKAFGYSLTGITSEKAVFIAFGKGNNGKTTLLSTFLRLLGDYSALLQIDTLMTRQENNNTQADLADLRGARFVLTSETEEGQRLAEGKLKRITQGMGRIKAVRKYENPIEFEETHKLWIDANHRPMVRATDDAIWNRLRLIPFHQTIPSAEVDRELPAKLLLEAEGILAWAVAGAVAWYREGLARLPEGEQETRIWRAEGDPIGRFLEDCCEKHPGASMPARELYLAFRSWVEMAGDLPITETAFGRSLTARGFEKEHTQSGWLYYGVRCRPRLPAIRLLDDEP
jgi:putative DNA primase/helicase